MVVINYVEWLPCAWKSLLIKQLEKNKEKVIHELWRVLNKNDFPWNGKNTDEINAIDRWFIDKESKRYDGGDLSGKNIYFDRSFLTHLAYSYAYSRFMNIPSLKNTVKSYESALNDGKLIVPDTIINISIPSEISIQRQEEKMNINPSKALLFFWRDKTFLDDLFYAYSKLYESYSWRLIDIDGRLTTEEKIEQIMKLSDLSSWCANLDLEAYLSKIL